MPQGSRWVFTLNNPVEAEKVALAQKGIENESNGIRYLIIGREVGEGGTPHLQGFVIFDATKTLRAAKATIGERAHLEQARGSSKQASDYCKKEGDFDEYGSFPNSQGRRSDIDRFGEWLDELGSKPSERDLSMLWPSLYLRYSRSLLRMVELRFPGPRLLSVDDCELREWQQQLSDTLDEDADDRKITWVVDREGNAGKSWFAKYLLTKREDVCYVRPGRLEDMALTLNPDCRVFIFDVPRSRLEHFQYAILEQLKDRLVFSPKYESKLIRLKFCPHVVVLSNEYPIREKLSEDRWNEVVLRPQGRET